MKISYSPLPLTDSLPRTVSVSVTNSGTRPGDEVVQLYIQDVVSMPVRPTQELRGFQRIHLEPGESREVQFAITSDVLAFYDHNLQWTAPSGTYRIMIGPNCQDAHLCTTLVKY